LILCASAISITWFGKPVVSCAQSLKLLRKPWTA
jgi:hypothetical protein